ncbi:uncharacterized protein LOC123559006 [Mercenaria mercenaria]|uniref:uncharacterized protein LOC123559006 n=1 Tax=Mercenaria mercenaria TaxID=6596 RepID=UPI00234E689E|nr:uncharacterized protein LOC123559006 [Mercenaria mercenaria]
MWFYFLCYVVLLADIRTLHGLDIFNFHDYCGATIYENVGELRFNAQQLPSYLPGNKCSVTVSLESDTFNAKPQAFFYFTKFDISIFCEDTNVTVIDGTSYRGTQIEGLPAYLCGHNKTLEEDGQYFQTESHQLTVTFRRSAYGKRFSGNFSIKFLDFYYGNCEGDKVYECPSGRCIQSVYHCSDDIKACGDDSCQTDTSIDVAETFLDSIVNILKNIGWIVLAVVAFYLFRIVFLSNREKIRNFFKGKSQTSRRESIGMHSVQLNGTPTDDILLSTEEVQPRRNSTNSSSRISSARSSISEPGPEDSNIDRNGIASDDVNMTLSDSYPGQATPSAPPPSYEDAMAPSYDHVMANEHIYKH